MREDLDVTSITCREQVRHLRGAGSLLEEHDARIPPPQSKVLRERLALESDAHTLPPGHNRKPW